MPLAIVAVLAGACGGGSATLSRGEYGSKLNAICRDFTAEMADLGQKMRAEGYTTPTLAAVSEYGDDEVNIAEKYFKRFEELRPADDAKDLAKRVVESQRAMTEDLKDALRAAKAGDQSGLTGALQRVSNDGKPFNAAANELGATACTE